MPASLPESTLKLAQSLFVSGFKINVISKQTGVKPGTIKTWANRNGWYQLRDKVLNQAELGVSSTISRELEQRSAQIQDMASAKLVEHARVLADSTPNTINGLAKEMPLVTGLIQNSDKLFGWSKSTQPSCLIQNNYLHEIAPDRVPQPVVSCGVSGEAEQSKPSV